MEKENLYGLYFWVFCSVLVIIGGILNIREEREKNEPDYSIGIMIVLVGFTPGSCFIVSFLILVGLIYGVVEFPNRILKILLKKKNAS